MSTPLFRQRRFDHWMDPDDWVGAKCAELKHPLRFTSSGPEGRYKHCVCRERWIKQRKRVSR